jgi:hypothetical protein
MLSMWRIGILVLVVLFAGVAYSKEHPNTETAETKKAPEAEQRGSNNNPVTVKILPSPDADAKAAKEEDHRQDKAIDDKRVMWATIWLAVVTTILAGVTAGLWIATYSLASDAKDAASRQAREMKISLRIARRSANASKKSAEAAERTVNTMKDTAERQLRAYVGVEQIAIQSSPTGAPNAGQIIIKNFGKTMAKDTQIWFAAAIETMVPVTDFPLGARKCKTVIMPTEGARFDEPLTGTFDLGKGIGNVYLWGRIDYIDVFDLPHWTVFRLVSMGREYVDGPNGYESVWRIKTCDEGNDAN